MSKLNEYAAIRLFEASTTTGGANTNDWVASMRGMTLIHANCFGAQTSVHVASQPHVDDDFEMHMADTLNVDEPDAGSWNQIKAKLGL